MRDNLSAFVDIVDTSPLPILSCIQHIHFALPLNESLLERIRPCPNLICIRIEDRCFTDYSQFEESELELLHPNMQSWAIESGSISRLKMALKLVDWQLEVLHSILSCVPAIETLHIDRYDMGSGCDNFFTWLIPQPPMPLLRLQGGNLEALQFETHLFVESLALYQDIFQCTTTMLKRVSFTCGHSSHILHIFPLLPPSDWQSIAVLIIVKKEEGTEMDLQTIDAALAGSQFRTLKHFSICGAKEFNAGLLILD
ncbi:hypothetical protein K438DRAFT_1972345 [Mycena galopus ATCC 62051]|nr:hypothetical protein K438DRAFT_1972345 [Mycena galopus ATCC 62051]